MITYAQQYPVSPVGQHTKGFLKQMRDEALLFLRHITGIPTESEHGHYATLMMLRIMVLYFLQQKGLRAEGPGYLSSQLQQVQEQRGKDRFYRYFLLPLFQNKISNRTSNEIFNVQTLHLFAEHQMEQEHAELQIADEAFVRLFALFDHYDWQLIDAGEPGSNTLYPTVLSDFFEQQINQKQTGAYYTGRDVTGYICENSIVRHLLAEAGSRHPDIFGSAGAAWRLLRENPDRYIRAELHNREMLPLETQREHEMRCARYHRLRELLSRGGIASSADMVTHNLAITQFALDALEHCQHIAVLRGFYASLEGLTVLDATCGTGALLIEALNVLLVFYRVCLERMQVVQDTSGEAEQSRIAWPHAHNVDILARIITNNLYGVDLVEEAADICAARLALTALGYSETGEESKARIALECNIRHGNALIGCVKADGEMIEDGCSESGYMNSKQAAFHWNREYREVMRRGGFDVIIGNPPYIEYSKVRAHYQTTDYETSSCGNLYAAVIERAMA